MRFNFEMDDVKMLAKLLRLTEIEELLELLLRAVRRRMLKDVRLVFTARIGSVVAKGLTMLVITDMQQCKLSIQPLDGAGNPAPVDGAPTWTVSDPALLALDVATDGLSATVIAKGPLGTGQVNVQADADLGAGTVNIAGTLDVQITASQATTLGISAGVPEPKPVAAPASA